MNDREVLELLLKNQTTMQKSFEQLNTRMDKIESRMGNIDIKQATTQNNIEHIRQSQARMEFELTEKISVIIESQKAAEEKVDKLSKISKDNIEFMTNTLDYVATKIDHVAADTSMLVKRVTRLEKISN